MEDRHSPKAKRKEYALWRIDIHLKLNAKSMHYGSGLKHLETILFVNGAINTLKLN